MLYDYLAQSLVITTYYKVVTYTMKVARLLLSCCVEGLIFLFFIIASVALLDVHGSCLTTVLLIAILYTLTLGRRVVFSSNRFFSFNNIAGVIPFFLFLSCMRPDLRSDTLSLIAVLIWIVLSRWPLLSTEDLASEKISYHNVIKKLIFCSILQCFYGLIIEVYYPSLLKSLEWELSSEGLKPHHKYSSQTGIQFFYDDRDQADKIERYLPEVINTLKGSIFYKDSQDLVLVQKERCQHYGSTQEETDYASGFYYPIKQYSYYFTGANQNYTLNEIYYSHNNPYRSVVIHELTHQLVSRYYGKWLTMFFLDTWKSEGYSEYMAATGCYSKKSELLAIVTQYSLSDTSIENPFSRKKSFSEDWFEDYLSAFLQTRYALDEKKIPPLEFFKKSYKAVSAQEIKDWLMQEDEPGS